MPRHLLVQVRGSFRIKTAAGSFGLKICAMGFFSGIILASLLGLEELGISPLPWRLSTLSPLLPPRQEQRALLNLEQQGYECYLPVLATEKLRQGVLSVVEGLLLRAICSFAWMPASLVKAGADLLNQGRKSSGGLWCRVCQGGQSVCGD